MLKKLLVFLSISSSRSWNELAPRKNFYNSRRACSKQSDNVLVNDDAFVQVRLCHKSLINLDDKPPKVFSLPVLCGRVCLVLDQYKKYAMLDACPPIGVALSATGVVDSEIGVIEDLRFRTKFYMHSGYVRGKFCPGGNLPLPLRWLAIQWYKIFKLGPPRLETYVVSEDKEGWISIQVPKNSTLFRGS